MATDKKGDQPSYRDQSSYKEWEQPLFEAWEDQGYFRRTPGFGENASQSYTVVIPPPNVTGVLHMDHALNDTIQDTCVRRARMQGYQTRWIVGTDHAGIATQTKVDKHLAEQGINRHEIGREAFIEACQDWRYEYGNTIIKQIKAMGCSCDYEHEQFTMSPELSKAVIRLFCDWYHDGLIFRGKRIVNWCPSCTTAIADDEVEYQDEQGHLWYLRYPLVEPCDGVDYIVVATTRPETMLGDSAVAVNPQDERFASLVGKKIMLPLVNREIPIVADFAVDKEFGTGCVKITPAHDPNDYATGKRHDLEQINIFDEHAYVVEGFGKYSGMSRDEAREEIVADFDALGLLDHIEDHDHAVMHCYRCHTTLEPWLSEQWFVAVERLKKSAMEAVENGKIRFYPDRWKHVYLDWLENLKDWCISRQLWWGHRIPMYYCDECDWKDASPEPIEICPICGSSTHQDENVLDTWFSSQLWPFATQGWGEEGMESYDLRHYYPTQLLSTARDIMGLWVARMVMASLYCCDDIPFEKVIIHPTVMGADGKPMSKSRGNGVDPMELMETYGADGMRFGLLMQVTGSQAMRFDENKLLSSRNFANKIRNAARFVSLNLDGYTPGDPQAELLVDRWMFSRLSELIESLDSAYAEYDFGLITRLLYSFFWNEFCDWYIEFSKSRLNGSEQERLVCQRNLMFVLEIALRLLHPIMPFVTEQIYQDLPFDKKTQHIMVAPWPVRSELIAGKDAAAEQIIEMVMSCVSGVRSVRARYSISPKTTLTICVKPNSQAVAQNFVDQQVLIADLANIEIKEVALDLEKPQDSTLILAGEAEVYVLLAGQVDFEAESARLKKAIAKLEKDREKFSKKLSNPGYLAKAAQEIIDKDTAKLTGINEDLERLNAQLAEINA